MKNNEEMEFKIYILVLNILEINKKIVKIIIFFGIFYFFKKQIINESLRFILLDVIFVCVVYYMIRCVFMKYYLLIQCFVKILIINWKLGIMFIIF